MFKFFRKYNKLILVVGGVFLMVAFLIQGTLSMFMGSPADRPIGRIGERELTVGDQRTAAAEMRLLREINPVLGQIAAGMAERDGVKWLLMVRDAQRMGLSASRQQVNQLLQGLGIGTSQLNRIAGELGLSSDMAHQALRHWIMLQQYRSLMLGQEHKPTLQQLTQQVRYINLMSRMQNAQGFRERFQYMQQAMQLRGEMQGTVRLSQPLVQWFVTNQRATVSGQALMIDAQRYLDTVNEPSEGELNDLFSQYRDDLPGEGEPYGFGYKYPDRVKLAWLALPVSMLRDHVQIDEADALQYYDQNKEQFRAEPETQPSTQPGAQAGTQPADNGAAQSDQPEIQPYQQVRGEVIDQLRTQEAEDLAQRMVSAAQAMLLSDARPLTQQGGYRVIPDDFEPTALTEIADRLEDEFGVRPKVQQRRDTWVPVDQLSALPGLGGAHLAGRPQVSFTDYVASARELDPADDDPLVALRLQTRLASQPVATQAGDRFLFRLSAAQASHAPESLDAVRSQVVRDARRRKAYEKLLNERDQWLQRALDEGFESLAEQAHVSQQQIQSTPRRRLGRQGELSVPSLPGIGQHETLIDTMFDVAERVSDRGRASVGDAPVPERSDAVAIAPRLSLCVFRVDEYQPLTRQQYEQQASSPRISSGLNSILLAGGDGPVAITRQAVEQRVGFEPIESQAPEDGQSPQPPQRRPGSI